MTAPAIDHDRTLIDWITVTHHERDHLAWALRGPVEKRNGLHAYRTAVQDGFGTVLASDGPQPRPHMLQMSGKPLQAWRAEGLVRDLVRHLTSQRVTCTRLDLARDTTGLWTPNRLQELVEADRYVANWMNVVYHHGKGNHGLTVQLGSRASTTYLRVYDKKAEREGKGEPCPFDRLSRWELVLKKPYSTKALNEIARLPLTIDEETGEETWPLAALHAAWLRDRLRITSVSVDRANNNQGLAETDPEWEAFLAGASDTVLAPEMDERDVYDQAHDLGRWAVRCVSRTLALIHEVGGDELVRELVNRGCSGRRSAKHRLLAKHPDQTLRALRSIILRE